MPEILTRPMRPDDLDRVMEIELQTFAIPWTRADMEGELNNRAARYHVLTEDGAVMAYAGTWFVIDEGHIINIAVAPECRGKGYGTRVMAAMMQNAVDLGVTYMTLEVRVGNVPALALYKKLGFKKAGVRKKYYEDNGEDAYIMVNDRLQLSIDRALQAMN